MPYFLDIVKQLEKKPNSERKEIIISLLKNKNIEYKLEEYTFLGGKTSVDFPWFHYRVGRRAFAVELFASAQVDV